MPLSKILLAATVAAVHSFAAADVITEAPTPTLAPRQVAGGPGTPILSTLHYAFTDLPYQVYPFAVLRGPQFGFNQCNSTTEGPTSNCQTLIFNSIQDFCLWGSPEPSGSIGNDEAKVVAYCTKPGHGTRVFPAGSITGLQWTKTSGYIQAVGFIKNSALSLTDDDQGGELDPHGADLQGNPLGGVIFSNGTADATGPDMVQVNNWNTFVGGNKFCFKACFNSVGQPDYCENRYDLIGCDYNMPSAAQDGQFTECEGEVQDVVGVYTTNGVVSTWSMPDPVTPPPYQPRVPASSNCKTWQSTDLFVGQPTATGGSSTAGATATGAGASNSASTGTRTSGGSGGAGASNTGSPSSAAAFKVPFAALGAVVGLVVLGGML